MSDDRPFLTGAVTGAITVELAGPDGTVELVPVPAGHGCVVPRGAWHRLLVEQPTVVGHATPGPGVEVRRP